MMKRSTLLLLLLTCSACRARQTNVERWRGEILEMEQVAKERLDNASDDELWERMRVRVAREYAQKQRRRGAYRRSAVGSAGSSGVAGLYIFDVSDLIQGVSDFAAPQIGDLRRPEDRGDRGEGYTRPSQGAYTEDALLEMITAALLPKDFEEQGGSVSLVNGRLIIREP